MPQAEAWNSALPCSGRIVSIKSHGQTARATFVLGDRQHSRCDGPGQRATAIFRVVKGKIVLWHQAGSSALPAAAADLLGLGDQRRFVELAPDAAQRALARAKRLDDGRVELPPRLLLELAARRRPSSSRGGTAGRSSSRRARRRRRRSAPRTGSRSPRHPSG